MTDKELNKYIDNLLSVDKQTRLDSNGRWASSLDIAMLMWEDRHPGTRPPSFAKIGPPPACFEGEMPPIYEEESKD